MQKAIGKNCVDLNENFAKGPYSPALKVLIMTPRDGNFLIPDHREA